MEAGSWVWGGWELGVGPRQGGRVIREKEGGSNQGPHMAAVTAHTLQTLGSGRKRWGH